MNIIDTVHKVVREYPGGSEALGPRIGMSAAVLRNKANPNNGTHHLTLQEASEIVGVTGDLRILQAFAAEHGCIVARADLAASGGGFVESMLRASASQGALAQAVQDALSDGVISESEMAQITSVGFGAQTAIMMLLGRIREMSAKRPEAVA